MKNSPSRPTAAPTKSVACTAAEVRARSIMGGLFVHPHLMPALYCLRSASSQIASNCVPYLFATADAAMRFIGLRATQKWTTDEHSLIGN
jgi:hypothetical protein